MVSHVLLCPSVPRVNQRVGMIWHKANSSDILAFHAHHLHRSLPVPKHQTVIQDCMQASEFDQRLSLCHLLSNSPRHNGVVLITARLARTGRHRHQKARLCMNMWHCASSESDIANIAVGWHLLMCTWLPKGCWSRNPAAFALVQWSLASFRRPKGICPFKVLRLNMVQRFHYLSSWAGTTCTLLAVELDRLTGPACENR